jgi:hypothetical protein
MTRDDIIRMAREWLPKAYRDGNIGDEPRFTKHNMEVAFAAGAAAEREACAKVCENIGDYDENVDEYYSDIYANAIRVRGQQ